MNKQTVSCKICGQPTEMTHTKKCDFCWEVTHRIEAFLLNAKGRKLIWELLQKYGDS